MKNTLKQLFAGLVGFFLAAIVLINDGPPTEHRPLNEQETQRAVIPPSTDSQPSSTAGDESGTDPGELRDNKKADEYLRALVHIKDEQSTNPGHTTWWAVYNLQSLVELGEEAIPGIVWVLEREHELFFDWYQQPVDVFGASHRRLPRNLDRVERTTVLFPNRAKPNLHSGFPVSLRLGLIETLERIGGPHAESALLTLLRNTERELELAFIVRGLQIVAADFHTDEIMSRITTVLEGNQDTSEYTDLDMAARRYLLGLSSALNKLKQELTQKGGPVNRGIPYRDKEETSKPPAVTMSSIFDSKQNLELETGSVLQSTIDRGLKFMELEHDADKEDGPEPPKLRTKQP